MSVEILSEKDRSIVLKNKEILGNIFGYKGTVGRVSASEAVRLIDEDLEKWSSNFEIYIKLLQSARQSLKSKLN